LQVDLDGNDNETDHLQWSQNKTGKAFNMMLNADMSLAFDIQSDASKKWVSNRKRNSKYT